MQLNFAFACVLAGSATAQARSQHRLRSNSRPAATAPLD